MADEIKGQFSLSFLTLQAQIKTLMEDAGGEKLIALLDALASLNATQQAVIIDAFTHSVNEIIAGNIELDLPDPENTDQLVDSLCDDITTAISDMRRKASKKGKFEVLDGGKSEPKPAGSVVTISELRRAREEGRDPILN